jgi:predicted nucleic acid-binding protein
VVVDASALGELLLRTERAESIAGVVGAADVALHVPALCDVELVSILRRALRGNLLTEPRALQAANHYLALPLTRHGHLRLLPRMLALRENFSAYDAAYLALAEQLRGELLSADERFARAARIHTAVTVVPRS